MTRLLVRAIIIAALILVAAFWAIRGNAHTTDMGWKYDTYCCNGDSVTGDCQEIPREAVTPIDGGWRIVLMPGDHRLVTKRHEFTWTHVQTKPSPDGRFHACLWPSENVLRCFYAPPFGA